MSHQIRHPRLNWQKTRKILGKVTPKSQNFAVSELDFELFLNVLMLNGLRKVLCGLLWVPTVTGKSLQEKPEQFFP